MARRISSETAAVLAFFLRYPEVPRYGLEILQATAVSSGTLYPILIRLEKEGILSSLGPEVRVAQSRPTRGRPRHYYRLTSGGRARAVADLDAWQDKQRKRGVLLHGSQAGSEPA